MKVRLDAERCVGHGRCYDLAPDVFGEDERGHCRVLRGDVAREQAAQARVAVENCPEDALALEE
jgi:ferredoxin